MRTLGGATQPDTPTRVDVDDTVALPDGLTHVCVIVEWDATAHFFCGEWTRSCLFAYRDINKGHVTCVVCASRVTDRRGS